MKVDIQEQNGITSIFIGMLYKNVDLNKLIIAGRYRINGASNGPKATIMGILDNISLDSTDSGVLFQVFYELYISGNIANIYIRCRNKGMTTFTDWKLLYNVS